MAFGFIGDIIEQVGETILPRGTRGRTIGAYLGDPEFGSRLSADIASGRQGQEAVSTPTVSQDPRAAPESAMSGDRTFVYQPSFTTSFTPRIPGQTRMPTQRATRTATTGADLVDIIPDIDISVPNFFGTDKCAQKMKKLVSFDKDNCPYVTRKQQAVLRKMLMYLPIEEVAYSANVTTDEVARLVSKNFAPRRKGISAADMRTANRVNNKILRGASKLGYNLTPKSKADFNKGC